MCKLDELMGVLEQIAPLSLSYKMIELGSYDNSGLLVKCSENADKILFSLDLSEEVIMRAIENNCDTIITHHPVIYSPVKSLGLDANTKPIVQAIKHGINIISMHLNLDVAPCGIDALLSQGLGAKSARILSEIAPDCGYGREFDLSVEFEQFKNDVSKTFKTKKAVFYGDGKVNKVASFCGGGDSEALNCVVKGTTSADTIVTSDMPHHVLKELIELGKKVVILPHYVSEQYGFEKFFRTVSERLNCQAETYYFEDKRFM